MHSYSLYCVTLQSAPIAPNKIQIRNRFFIDQLFLAGGTPPQGVSINFKVTRDLMCSTTWKVWSINLPRNTFATFLKSRGLEQRTTA